MSNKAAPTGTPRQERLFEACWADYWLMDATHGAVGCVDRGEQWREAMAVFASNRAQYGAMLDRAQIEIWMPKK